MRKSKVVEDMTCCMLCGRPTEAVHHLLSGNQRKIADEDGLFVGLCSECHNMYEGKKELGQSCDMHHCRKLEVLGKIIGQLAWEKDYYRNLCIEKLKSINSKVDQSREAFLRRYGKKYL
jgi:hypothetical protein